MNKINKRVIGYRKGGIVLNGFEYCVKLRDLGRAVILGEFAYGGGRPKAFGVDGEHAYKKLFSLPRRMRSFEIGLAKRIAPFLLIGEVHEVAGLEIKAAGAAYLPDIGHVTEVIYIELKRMRGLDGAGFRPVFACFQFE